MPVLTETQPIDYPAALNAAIGSWWYVLTFLLPGLVYLFPAIVRWRFILWLIPVAFVASCVGYFVYWRSIDWALMDYYRRTGYFNTADTWYVFMPILRGVPNAVAATTVCTLIGWALSRRPANTNDSRPGASVASPELIRIETGNPYEPPLVFRE